MISEAWGTGKGVKYGYMTEKERDEEMLQTKREGKGAGVDGTFQNSQLQFQQIHDSLGWRTAALCS